MTDYVRIAMAFDQMFFEPFATDAYDIKPKSCIQKVLFWLLKKTECVQVHFDHKHLVKETIIPMEKVVSLLLRKCWNQIEQLGHKPEHIYIGKKEFYELASDMSVLGRPISFALDAKVNFRNSIQFWGIPVTVIPWMEGVLIV